jgi:hypothetical protein
MHRNPYWLLFLTLIGLATAGYTVHTLVKIRHFQRLDLRRPLQSVSWSVSPLSDEDFVITADYNYLLNETIYNGHATWDEHYLNPGAAEEKILKLSGRSQWVWIDSRNPENSALQKQFPIKQCISALFLWALFAYFLYMGSYVKACLKQNLMCGRSK